ncbi:hypothetical protein NWP22_01100 [Anabaenopsis tanganyikae CS-531]|uniref:Uncharacterized protein n=2 Tax=Anabaenopsis TaxID=110103 RepID=A0ABT6K9J8_9CYAN|nr:MULTISPECIES: hypothetical protein [Anabaenopsis]MDB9540972.1 hypothetical protein [Anabaenopsis arnoldii]MDH6093410.1 hypothetical protein [Anabaenopsis arnoldii]MDH6104492.1 hypothetical protein [Anabaenopsis tanganyikae CS-531]
MKTAVTPCRIYRTLAMRLGFLTPVLTDPPTVNRQPSTVNRQPSTVNRQPSTVNRHQTK